jgi:hypothetical protein
MPSSTSHRAWHDSRRTAALWVGLLAGPVVWFTLLEANYVMSYVACESRHTWFLHGMNLVSAAVVALAALVAWRSGPAEDAEHPTSPITRETSESRARWMSLGGAILSLWFVLVILAMEIPVAVIPSCVGR